MNLVGVGVQRENRGGKFGASSKHVFCALFFFSGQLC